jgi:hypothetical protein
MMPALRNSGKTQIVSSFIRTPATYWFKQDDNLHHGQFLFRHKGKKKKGKPNYPPTKLLVKARRHMRKKLPPELKAELRISTRKSRRDWTQAVKNHNAARRNKRLIAKGQLEGKVLLFEPRGMFR